MKKTRLKKVKKKPPVKQYRTGRVCKKFGCKQRLSVYNSEEYCHVHRRESLMGETSLVGAAIR